jgi:hypothetical protein
MNLAAFCFDGQIMGEDGWLRSESFIPTKWGFAPVKTPSVAADGPDSEGTRETLYRFFLNLYSTPTEMAKLTSNWLVLGA